MINPKHIIISRTDNIGDVILTLPLAEILKQHYPDAKISLLARNYVQAIVENCPHVDTFISWDTLHALPKDEAISKLKSFKADCFIHAFPKKDIATLAKKANIANRIGTSRRLYHLLTCNKRIKFSRAKSQLHEAQLNLKLLAAFNLPTHYTLQELIPKINIKNAAPLPDHLNQYLKPDQFNLIIHPLSNGHTREWPLEYFNELIHRLDPTKFNILITGSQKESEKLHTPMITQCPNATDLTGKLTLNELIQLIQYSDGLIANSTGPLHIAAALNIKTLGLFPPSPTMNPSRWGPLGPQAQYLVTDNPCTTNDCADSASCSCIRAIGVSKVKRILLQWPTKRTQQSSELLKT